MIKLGDKVKDIYTGLKGVVIGRTEFINGCIQFEVAPPIKKDGTLPDSVGIDIDSLEVITTKRKKAKKKETGGPSTKSKKMRGY